MIQFLKPRSSRRRSQRHLDVLEPAPTPLPDVTDWLTENAEPAGLTAEEAAEIQFAFQQQADDRPELVTLDATLVDASLTLNPTTLIPELAINAVTPVEILADPLDLTQVELLEPLLLLPESLESPVSDGVAAPSELAIVPIPQLVDAEALVKIRLETCSSGLAIGPAMVEPVEIELVTPTLTQAIAAEPVADVDQGMAIDDLGEQALAEPAAEAPIDWVNANWASEAVDVAAIEASAAPTGEADTTPSTYFQYYLDETAIGGSGTADETPAAYVTPWRQPAVPRGLIGAGVLGATLVSGFVIADTVKTTPATAVKRPTSPLQSLSAKDQAMTTAARPKAMPPESMQPEVALPKPKSMTMMRPTFPPLAPLGQPLPMSALGSAIAGSETRDAAPQRNANITTGLTLNAPPAPVITAYPAAGPEVTSPPVDRPVNSPQLLAPKISQNPPPPVEPLPFTPASSPEDLPELTPDVTIPVPTPALTPPATQPVAPAPRSELTPEPISSPLQRVPLASTEPVQPVPTPPAQNATVPPVDVVVPPSMLVPQAPAVDQPAAIDGRDRVFTRDGAPSVLPGQTAATPMPPSAIAQPIADRSIRLPQMQTLLARPAANALVPMVSHWRSLSAVEANDAIQAKATELNGYTRQQLNQPAYVQAYQAVSQTADGVPSFGFIDYQRRLIILPPMPETAVNPPIEQSRAVDGVSVIAQRIMSL